MTVFNAVLFVCLIGSLTITVLAPAIHVLLQVAAAL